MVPLILVNPHLGFRVQLQIVRLIKSYEAVQRPQVEGDELQRWDLGFRV